MPSAASPRRKTFLLAEPEQRVLHAIAARLPARVMPDHLTALVAMLVALLVRAAGNLRTLAEREPAGISRPGTTLGS